MPKLIFKRYDSLYKEPIMNIRLFTRQIERTQTLVDHAQRRAIFAFDRFGDMVRDIDIRINDINGPRGGAGIACLARVRLVSGDDVLVESRAISPEDGITLTISRLANRLRRLTSRHQDHG
jgi:putative sigma-54 modulation protein